MKSEKFACINMLCSFQKTQKEITGRENSNFFHILLTVNKMQTKVTVIGHKNTMLYNLCPIRESNWSTESTCLKSLRRACQVNFHVQLKTKYFFSFSYLIILFKP